MTRPNIEVASEILDSVAKEHMEYGGETFVTSGYGYYEDMHVAITTALEEKDKKLALAVEVLERVAAEADREAKNIGESARRGDQGKAETFRWIRDAALSALKGDSSEKRDETPNTPPVSVSEEDVDSAFQKCRYNGTAGSHIGPYANFHAGYRAASKQAWPDDETIQHECDKWFKDRPKFRDDWAFGQIVWGAAIDWLKARMEGK